MKIHYGCSVFAPEGWENFDSSPVVTLQRLPVIGRVFEKGPFHHYIYPKNVRRGNISKGLPVKNSSARLVYCSHVLEHLSLEEFQLSIRNTYKMLKPNGVFRFVLPDLAFCIEQYQNNPSDSRAIQLMESTLLGIKKKPRGLNLLRECFGGISHLWMWDYPGIENELKSAGFSSIRKAHFSDSEFKEFNELENEERWENALGVECKK